tara:strand:- start:572 stop:847 length:276 start_codon:yes stop_codon:yes gene_type:complete
MKNMENRINGLAKQVVTQVATFSEVSIDVLDCSIYTVLCEVSIENEATYNMLDTFIRKEIKKIDRNLYETVYPPMQMDMNGNYTTNPKLWV